MKQLILIFCTFLLSYTATYACVGCATDKIHEQKKEAVILNELEEPPEKEILIEEIPLFESAWSIRGEQDKIIPMDIAYAMSIFYLEWNDKFGDKNYHLLTNLDDL